MKMASDGDVEISA